MKAMNGIVLRYVLNVAELVHTVLKHIIIQIAEVIIVTPEHKDVIIVTSLLQRLRKGIQVTQMVCVIYVTTLVDTLQRLAHQRVVKHNTI